MTTDARPECPICGAACCVLVAPTRGAWPFGFYMAHDDQFHLVWLALGFLAAVFVYIVVGAAFLVWADQFVKRDKRDDRFALWLMVTWPIWVVVYAALLIWYRRWPTRRA